MHKKISTVTVALSAYNEEKNIVDFLKSVLTQKEEGYILEKILIVSDGSTDKTVMLAKTFNSPKIIIKEYKKRIGKSSRLNFIYKSLDTDFLVQTDSDVIFAHPFVIRDLIKPLIHDKNVGMCGGNPLPLKGKTFIEKSVNCSAMAYIYMRKHVRGGNNVFSADGRILAYKKDLIIKITIPEDMIANDMFTYYSCLFHGYRYKYIETAVVFYRSPQTLKDQIIQNTRFRAAPLRMKKYFSKKLVEYENSIPRLIFIKSVLLQLLQHPILSLSIYIINIYCVVKARVVEKKLNAKWEMAYSTKKLTF